MKPHIAQTVADLKAEAARLADMIATLERYGAETDPTAPVPQVQHPREAAPPAPAAKHSTPNARRRASISSKPRKPKAAPALADGPTPEPSGVTDMVRAVVSFLPAQFSRVEVIDAIEKRWPERMEDIKPMAIDGVLHRFRTTGELVECGTRPGLTGPLTLHKRP
jgi:hypothetical protein